MHQHRRTLRDEAGFTLLEILVVVALIGVLMAMAMMVSPALTQTARADASISQALDAIRSAREVAISQRRNVELRFINDNALQTARVEIDALGQMTGTTVLRTVELENHMKFQLDDDAPEDTPDLFGRTGGIAFGASPRRMFTSEGTFVNANGDVLNGTAFMSITGQKNSARAITIMGATALIRPWRWNGSDWVE